MDPTDVIPIIVFVFVRAQIPFLAAHIRYTGDLQRVKVHVSGTVKRREPRCIVACKQALERLCLMYAPNSVRAAQLAQRNTVRAAQLAKRNTKRDRIVACRRYSELPIAQASVLKRTLRRVSAKRKLNQDLIRHYNTRRCVLREFLHTEQS